MPTISVIVPVYNTEKYLHRCIDSILAQTFTDFELLLVDDGSTDSSGAICDEFATKDERIHVFHQKNQGQASARNVALDWVFENSDSEFISFIDSDDWVHPRYLELLIEGIKRYGVNICQCRFSLNESKNVSIEDYDIISLITTDEAYSQHFSGYMCDKLFHKVCWQNMRFPDGRIFEDIAIGYKLLFSQQTIAFVDAPLYFYYQRPEGTTNRVWTSAKLAQIDAWEDQLRFALKHGSKPVLQMVLKRFCWVYKHQCEEITLSEKISNRERKRYHFRLLTRLRIVLLRYRKELKEIGIYNRYSEWAFPKSYWCYWTLRGVWGKLKRLLIK